MDLLDFTRIRLEPREVKIQPVDLTRAAYDSVATVRPYAIQMEVSIDVIQNAEAVIMADPDDIAIIFNNLISNAVKYNVRGGKVEITIDKTDSDAIIIFSDTGIGIRPEDMPGLFTEFVRIKRDETKEITGSGLGLSIVKKVTDLYKGSILVESNPGKGTIFTVRLPEKQNI